MDSLNGNPSIIIIVNAHDSKAAYLLLQILNKRGSSVKVIYGLNIQKTLPK